MAKPVTVQGKSTDVVVRKVTIVYFPILGRGDPLAQMFEYHGQPFEKVAVSQQKWAEIKGTPLAGEFNCMPIVKIYTRG